MSDDAEEFARITEQGQAEESKREAERRYRLEARNADVASATSPSKDEEDSPGAPVQWALHGPGFRPTTNTVEKLKAGCYDIHVDQHGPFAVPALPPTGLLLELPEMRSDHVLELVDSFWASESDYKNGNEFVHGGAAYRCGIMLFGPPGTGKSCTIKLVAKKLVERGGIVFYADNHPAHVNAFLGDFSRIEKDRKCVVILEDFDTLIHRFSESDYLQMLDSAKSIDNVMFVATTNYPERLDPRIYNRPGRFTHVVMIGLPGPAGRRAFLNALLKDKRDLDRIVGLTTGFSIDHLSALVNAVYREKKDLEKEAQRLRTLFKMPKCEPTGGPMGLNPATEPV